MSSRSSHSYVCGICGKTVYSMMVHNCPGPKSTTGDPVMPGIKDLYPSMFTNTTPLPCLTINLPGGGVITLVIPPDTPDDVRRELTAAFDRAVAAFAGQKENSS